MRLPLALLAGLAAIAPVGVGRAQDDPDSVILDRQLIMQALDEDSGELGKIVSGEIKPDTMVQHSRAIAKSAREAYESFKAKVPGGGAKPEIWTNWADFSKRMEAFISNADLLVKASETGSVVAVTDRLIDALPCKECHDLYRIETKK